MGSGIPVIVAVLSAAGAIAAAALAARSASRTKTAEIEAARVLQPERRRAEIFESLVEALFSVWELTAAGKAGDAKAFEKTSGAAIRRFMHWVQIYGSDEAVTACLQFMQAIYHAPPPNVLMRLLADLVVVARRELGWPDTQIGPLEVMGMRITDVYTDAEIYADLTEPVARVFRRHNWIPPWTSPS